ncbi:hypothetical protein F4861DRAFT_173156 [Xylaria intraflava]|nr:hypothetical protein F4861DRAFT_173156 [Xylaria intraflava]
MDHTSAIGVAAGVASLVEFASKVVRRFFEVRASGRGQPAEVVSLAAYSSDLSSMASAVQRGIQRVGSSHPGHTESMSRLARECFHVEVKVRAALNKLATNPTSYMKKKKSMMVVAIRSVWSEGEFEEWRKQLDRVRDQIQMNVMMCVLDGIKKMEARNDHTLQTVVRIENAIESMSGFRDVREGRQLSDSSRQAKKNEAIWASIRHIDLPMDLEAFAPSCTPTRMPMPTMSETPALKKKTKTFAHGVRESLYIAEMSHRENRVNSAFPNTFQWLFDDNDADDNKQKGKPKLSFQRWLKSQEETVFWITGIPGSGKSTLMKFIINHHSFASRLQEWAGENRVYIAKFYFWNPGSKIQRSRIGLLRSLLQQLLNQRPELTEDVTLRRRLFFDIVGEDATSPEWEWPELEECMVRLVLLLQTTSSRLVLFVDGLDEYEDYLEENPNTHKTANEMVDFLISLNQKYGVKLCVSSRPLNYFRDKFRHNPSLTMQEFTQPDIDHYVEVRLTESPVIRDLREVETESVAKLIGELKTKTKGVFLWAILVIEQLLLISRDNPRMDAIQKVIRDSPEDISKLYDSIQKRIGLDKEGVASRLYQLIMAWKRTWSGQMEATFLWLADGRGLAQGEYPRPQKERHIAQLTKNLLRGHTKGTLQISDPQSPDEPYTVDFCHRTAYEWLWRPHNWERIIQKGPADYQPILLILAVLVNHARSLRRSSKYSSFLKRCIHRIFMLAGDIPDTPNARAKLASIIHKLDFNHLQYLGTDSILFRTAIPIKDRIIDLNATTWAAAWACHPYLRGKLEADPDMALTSWVNPLDYLLQRDRPKHIPLLETAIFGFRHCGSDFSLREDHWFINARNLGPWQASQRLETIKLLLERGLQIGKYMKKPLTSLMNEVPRDSTKFNYASLLLDIASNPSTLESFDSKRRAAFPADLIRESRKEREFPAYEIREGRKKWVE